MNPKYKVVIVGYGKRGQNHFKHFMRNGNFEIAGICDRNPAKLKQIQSAGIATSRNLETLLTQVECDVFCLCTPPDTRYGMIKLAVDYGAKMIAIEKPIALSTREGLKIKRILDHPKIKAVVCLQHRYGKHYQKVKQLIDSEKIGAVHTLYASATGWALHMLPHLISYMQWYNGNHEAEWVMAQAAGKKKLAQKSGRKEYKDPHPSPDYIGGFIQFANGTRGIVECGAGAPDMSAVKHWWHRCRIRAVGTDGFAEVITGDGWRAVTRKGLAKGPGTMNYCLDMPGYIQGIADWLQDPRKVHPCNFTRAYHGFEIMFGLLRSAVCGGQIPLPLQGSTDEIKALKKKMVAKQVIASSKESAAMYFK
jgi:predicted dehydrogenase